jgi:hypothetical protein
MAVHRVPQDQLEASLREIVRSGEKIDSLYPENGDWVVITEDRIETRAAS